MSILSKYSCEELHPNTKYHLLSGTGKHREETCTSESAPQCSQMCEKPVNSYLPSMVGCGQTPLIMKEISCPAVGHKKKLKRQKLRILCTIMKTRAPFCDPP